MSARIAAVQGPPHPDSVEAACAQIAERLAWADRAGVDIVLFPEAILLGHSYDPETIARRADAMPDVLAALCARIAGARATAIVGGFSRWEDGIRNTAFVLEGRRFAGCYAKMHPNEPGVVAGTEVPVFARAAPALWHRHLQRRQSPRPAARAAEQGAALLLYPLDNLLRPETAARWRAKSLANLVARAHQTGCWVASADVVGTLDGRVSHGCTAIVAPDGTLVTRVPEGSTGTIVADLR